MHQLELVDTETGARRRVPLAEASLLVGSAVDCDLVLPRAGIAAHHCRIESAGSRLEVVHLAAASDAPTLVNGRPIERAPLDVGEVLRIGPFQLALLGARSEPLPSAAPRSPPAPQSAPSPTPPVVRAPAPVRAPARPSWLTSRARPASSVPALLIVAGVLLVGGAVAFVLLRGDDGGREVAHAPAGSAAGSGERRQTAEELLRELNARRPRGREIDSDRGEAPAAAPALELEPHELATEEREPAAAPRDVPPADPRPPQTDAPAVANAASELHERARRHLDGGDFVEAKELLELALDRGAPAEEKGEIARDHERASRPLKLAARLAELLAAKLPSNPPEVWLRDGTRGRLVRADGSAFVVEIDRVEKHVAPADVDARTLLELSGRVPLAPDETLDRAFVALACADDKTLFACLDKAAPAAADGSAMRASIDSLLAFQRRLERVPPRGFLHVDSKWLTWEEKAEADLRAEIQVAVAAMLAPKGDPVKARARLTELVAAGPAIVLEQLEGERTRVERAFSAAPEQEKLAKLRARAVELRDARKHALTLIFDEEKYFYPYHPPACPPDKAAKYPEVQREVDLRVDAVRAIWGREEDDAPEPHVALSATLVEQVRELKLLRSLLFDLGRPRDADDPTVRTAWCLPDSTRTLHLRNFALDEYERARLDQDAKIALLNAGCLPADGGPTREELEQVLVTNRYRAMLGRRVLAYNAKLWSAARLHSDWMSRKGQLSHFEDDPERASPEQRMKLAGYDHGAGENCAMGRMGPREVLDGWCHSSGHHRNLLYESHTELGSGQSGSYWTQCFGGGREYKGNLIRD